MNQIVDYGPGQNDWQSNYNNVVGAFASNVPNVVLNTIVSILLNKSV